MKRKLIIVACVVVLAWCCWMWYAATYTWCFRAGTFSNALRGEVLTFRYEDWSKKLEIQPSVWIKRGMMFYLPTVRSGESKIEAELPIWLIALLAVAGIVLAARRKKTPAGHCLCGYDLTGNVSGICPECGCTIQVVQIN